MMIKAMEPILNIAINAARQAGSIMLRYRDQLNTLSVTEKSQNNPVSEVDVRAEQIIIQTIQKAYPRHTIIAEESGVIEGSENVTWIIDPLDGTSNYLHGYPHYAVSIAVKVDSRIEHGVIYDPSRQEIFSASRGRGARVNNHRMRVGKRKELNECLVASGFAAHRVELTQTYFDTLKDMAKQCAGLRRGGSAALDLAYVACGRLDGVWEFKLQPWDVAAGALMIREAGGLISDFDGGENYLQSGNVIAANPKVFKQLHKALRATLKDIVLPA